ncbi:SH3 domain-containing protein [Kallotenue papyrolyticum]|uniref:SH3 domain-containing protein n=1 Tax=Kallotenue papyrolyticum TaxID=1325125 RepID=UPI0004785EBD|nr:SH3 domain-containing protein [Kallotenue papyrolyticum]
MRQKQERRSEMWWRGHNDALAGDPPNESYYHYYYDYKLAYNQTRREQQRARRRQRLQRLTRGGSLPLALALLALLAGGLWYLVHSGDRSNAEALAPTVTPRPTPRPTLTPFIPTATSAPVLRVDGFAVVTGTDGVVLRARAKPGTESQIVTRFREGEQVRILEGPQSADGMEWWRVEAAGQSGWAAAPFLQAIPTPTTP